MSPNTSDRHAVRLRVEGKVQGVGYRWWTVDQAVALGVTGTVRNLPDGSVEVLAFGAPDVIEALERATRRGPPSAHVERVTATPLPPDTTVPIDFRIEG